MRYQSKIKKLFNVSKDSLYTGLFDAVGFGTVTNLEMNRFWHVNEAGREGYSRSSGYSPSIPNYDSPTTQLSQNMGDFYDGYVMSLLGYYLLSVGSLGKIPENIRLGLASLISGAVVVGNETGMLFGGSGTADYSDIPAGLLGAAAFIGTHYLAKKLGSHLAKRSSKRVVSQTAG